MDPSLLIISLSIIKKKKRKCIQLLFAFEIKYIKYLSQLKIILKTQTISNYS